MLANTLFSRRYYTYTAWPSNRSNKTEALSDALTSFGFAGKPFDASWFYLVHE